MANQNLSKMIAEYIDVVIHSLLSSEAARQDNDGREEEEINSPRRDGGNRQELSLCLPCAKMYFSGLRDTLLLPGTGSMTPKIKSFALRRLQLETKNQYFFVELACH